MSTVTIIGGHGKVALLAAPHLVEAGHRVRSVIRNPDHREEVAATGAEPVVADVENLDVPGLVEVLSGSDVVVFSAGAGGGSPARTRAVDHDAAVRSMQAAGEAGISRYVMVSYYGAGTDNVPEDDPFYPTPRRRPMPMRHCGDRARVDRARPEPTDLGGSDRVDRRRQGFG